MTYYQAPHEATDKNKLQAMIAHLNSGGQLPPVLVMGEMAFTGSHRLAAWDAYEMEAEVIELSADDYIAAMDVMGLDWEYDEIADYNDFCAALLKVTDDTEVRNAIKDQV